MMECNLLTIFTPTYNRSYILPKLYETLLGQTDKNFEWILVDDGSTDQTEEIVRTWIEEGMINICYLKQPNQGKHVAINKGLDFANGELFFIVDSDDSLKLDAVEKIRDFWRMYGSDKFSGILSYREFPDGKLVGTPLPKEVKQCKLRDAESEYGSSGDKVVIYRTEIISQFRYPKFEGEKFFGESFVFNQIDDMMDMLVMDEKIYIFDYQKDGLSQNFRKLYRENPLGMLTSMKQALKYKADKKEVIKTLAHIGCISIKTNNLLNYFREGKSMTRLISFPFAIGLYIKIFILKANDVKPFK